MRFSRESGKTAFYKISAVNESYDESPLSGEAKAATRAMSDDELLTMIQKLASDITGKARIRWRGWRLKFARR